MVTNFCIICGEQEGLENHHLVPRSVGGLDEDTNMITLCRVHHGSMHGFTTGKKSLSELTKAALKDLKGQGRLGKAGKQNLALPQTREGTVKHREATKVKAEEFARKMNSIIMNFKQQGFTNVKVAEELNKLKYEAPGGRVGKWTSVGVARCLKRV